MNNIKCGFVFLWLWKLFALISNQQYYFAENELSLVLEPQLKVQSVQVDSITGSSSEKDAGKEYVPSQKLRRTLVLTRKTQIKVL